MINLDEADVADVGASVERAADRTGLTAFLSRAATRAVRGLREDRARDRASSTRPTRRSFWPTSGLSESGLDRVIRATYDLLGYMSFFTVGEDECRAWSIPARHGGAGRRRRDPLRHRARLHPRRGRRLRRLIARGSLAACRDHGEMRLEGKEYIVADGDIINFRHAT